MRAVLAVAIVLCLFPAGALAAKAKKPAAKPKTAQPAAPTAPSAAPQQAAGATAAPAEDLSKVELTELLERAGKHYRDQDYDQVLPLAQAVLARPEATVDQKLDAYLLSGSSLAIIGDAVEAEKPFRFLLRGRPDYDMPAETAPKILAIFRKVQVEERAIVQQMRELERNRVVKELKLTGDPPQKATGGLPLKFDWRLRDPRGMVARMELRYRREGEPAYASMPLARDDAGGWTGAIPGEWTQSEKPYRIEYFLTTADGEGRELLDLAAATSPLAVQVEAGSVPTQTPIYKNGWFWGGVGVAAVALGVAAYFLVAQAQELPKTDLGTIQAR